MHAIRPLVTFIGIAAAIWTLGISLYIVLMPTETQKYTHRLSADGTMLRQEEHSTTSLLRREGWIGLFAFVLWPLSLPIMIGITGARAAWQHKQGLLWGMAGAMLVFSFLAGFSIGGAFMPAAGGLFVAALLSTALLKWGG